MKTELAEIQDVSKLTMSLNLASEVISKDYLYKLSEYDVLKLSESIRDLDISKFTRIYKIHKMVSDKKESVLDKFVTVLNAAYSSHATVITIISGHKEYTDYYIGVVSKDINQTNESIDTQGATLQGVLTGNFPGMEIEAIKGESKTKLLNNTFVYDHITSISGIASIRKEENSTYDEYVQGIEHLVDSLQGREYSVVVIADPVSASEIASAKLGYESLYTQLAPFAQTSVSFNESESITLTKTNTEGVTDTIGESTALTQNYSKTSGWSESDTQGSSKNKNTGKIAGTLIGAGIGGALAVAATVATGGVAAPLIAIAAGAGVVGGGSVGGGLGDTFLGSSGTNSSKTTSTNGNVTEGSSESTTKNSSVSTQKSTSDSEAEGTTQGKTIQFNSENKTVKNLMDNIDKNIERLKFCESYGAFNCATYVISSDPETNSVVASGYNALMRGDNSSLQASHINNWDISTENGKRIKEYLMKFTHPMFVNSVNSDVLLSPASIINSYELAVNMGLPKKSIKGLSVLYKSTFGKNVITSSRIDKSVSIGKLSNLGIADGGSIALDINSLNSHLFVTGSTGTGKSNTIYKLLDEITRVDSKIHFMVVEPAKGEYKHAFYKHPRIKTEVYGTNPKKMKLLKINPFSFPDDVHLLEHVDRIVEIFNVCWPMYAAMPAILKNAVIMAYEKCGWDITNSYIDESNKVYPCFADVLECINEILDDSSFSQDNKGDYIGALCTRVESLTTGLNGMIFNGNEIPESDLFDNNVIVDLSRVGSVETKSLIMGLLVMKLQEYRMASGLRPNQELRHIMVLEEAHNLLKKTSTEQSADSSNMVGKSVEMITNAIAEMRTYGEGFFIVDQAPNLLDTAAIRNTNTKIVLRLPENEDREIIGKSMALSDEQILELSKLDKGCAAVYQNDWEEAVLCQFEQYHKSSKDEGLDELLYQFDAPTRIVTQSDIKKEVLKNILDVVIDEEHAKHVDRAYDLEKYIMDLTIGVELKNRIRKVLSSNVKLSLEDISGIVSLLYDGNKAIEKAKNSNSIEEWNESIICNADPELRNMSNWYIETFIQCLLIEQTKKDPDFSAYVEKWVCHMKEVR